MNRHRVSACHCFFDDVDFLVRHRIFVQTHTNTTIPIFHFRTGMLMGSAPGRRIYLNGQFTRSRIKYLRKQFGDPHMIGG